MPHDIEGFNGNAFAENLNQILTDNKVLPADVAGSLIPFLQPFVDEADGQGQAAQVPGYLASFNLENPLPTTWAAFIEDFRTTLTLNDATNPRTGIAYFLFLNAYRAMLGIDVPYNDSDSATNSTIGGDWSILNQGDDPNLVTVGDIEDQFENAFHHFLSTYPYELDGSSITATTNVKGDPIDTIYVHHAKFLTTTAVLDNVPDFAYLNPTDPVNINSYQRIYEAFFGPGPNNGFTERLITFYHDALKRTGDEMEEDGYFIPSLEFSRWFEEIQQEFSKSIGGDIAIGGTSLSGSGFKRVLILDRIFSLLVDMIEVLQRVAAAQANRLTFLTQWQKAYTDSLNQIHTFSKLNGDKIDGSIEGDRGTKEVQGKVRDELNKVNSTYTEQLRGNRDVIKDDAKALQSSVNQSNDAVNQQSNMATAILQQFSTILQSIFR